MLIAITGFMNAMTERHGTKALIISDSVYDGDLPRAELAEREILYITIDHSDLVVEVR